MFSQPPFPYLQLIQLSERSSGQVHTTTATSTSRRNDGLCCPLSPAQESAGRVVEVVDISRLDRGYRAAASCNMYTRAGLRTHSPQIHVFLKRIIRWLVIPTPPGRLEPWIVWSLVCQSVVHAVNGLNLAFLHQLPYGVPATLVRARPPLWRTKISPHFYLGHTLTHVPLDVKLLSRGFRPNENHDLSLGRAPARVRVWL